MNFIQEYKNAIDPNTCKDLMDLFERDTHLHSQGTAYVKGIPTLDNNIKQSTEIDIDASLRANPDWSHTLDKVFVSLSECLEKYKREYSFIDKTNTSWRITNSINFQRFLPGEGFYEWHCENEKNNRLLVFMFYLNSIEVGGGTEFNYEMPNSTAEIGKCLIWPADWTHFHKSIVAPYEKKYIITGWYVYD